jgi:two-component system chemotaxis response regulator CheY
MFPIETRILIADDLSSLRELLKAYLHRLGYLRITEAEDGNMAYQAMISAKAAGSPIDLIISDWNMPKATGLEFLKAVRAVPDWKSIPFILLTTESEKPKVMEAIMAGATNYMVKPVEQQVLEEKLLRTWQKINDVKKN